MPEGWAPAKCAAVVTPSTDLSSETLGCFQGFIVVSESSPLLPCKHLPLDQESVETVVTILQSHCKIARHVPLWSMKPQRLMGWMKVLPLLGPGSQIGILRVLEVV